MNKFLKYLVWRILTFNLAGTQVSLKKTKTHDSSRKDHNTV